MIFEQWFADMSSGALGVRVTYRRWSFGRGLASRGYMAMHQSPALALCGLARVVTGRERKFGARPYASGAASFGWSLVWQYSDHVWILPLWLALPYRAVRSIRSHVYRIAHRHGALHIEPGDVASSGRGGRAARDSTRALDVHGSAALDCVRTKH